MNPYDPENKMETLETAYPLPYMSELMDEYEGEEVTYAGDTGELLDTDAKKVAHFERQIEELGAFLLARHDNYIIGSAVESAIHIMKIQQQKIRRLEKVQRDYARDLLRGNISMHQPIEDEGTYGQNAENPPPRRKMREFNLIDPKQGSKGPPSGTGGGPDRIDPFDRAKEVV